MSDQERREDDVWIVEHLFGAKWEVGNLMLGQRIMACGKEHTPTPNLPHYALDREDAMDVLLKCMENRTIVVASQSPQKHFVSLLKFEGVTFHTEAETFELAVCLFAKKLFSSLTPEHL